MSSRELEKFVEESVLDIIIPEASQLDIEEALSSPDDAREADAASLIPLIRQRDVLFFGVSLSECSYWY